VIHKHVVNLLHVSAFFGHLLTTDFFRRLPTEDGRKWPKHVGGLQVYISLCLITVQLCVCVYVYIYIYTHTHTYIHTYTHGEVRSIIWVKELWSWYNRILSLASHRESADSIPGPSMLDLRWTKWHWHRFFFFQALRVWGLGYAGDATQRSWVVSYGCSRTTYRSNLLRLLDPWRWER
jgi:hypothetical protein